MSGQYWCGEGDEADELMEAAADPRMRTVPKQKVSRERVGSEVTNPNPNASVARAQPPRVSQGTITMPTMRPPPR